MLYIHLSIENRSFHYNLKTNTTNTNPKAFTWHNGMSNLDIGLGVCELIAERLWIFAVLYGTERLVGYQVFSKFFCPYVKT